MSQTRDKPLINLITTSFGKLKTVLTYNLTKNTTELQILHEQLHDAQPPAPSVSLGTGLPIFKGGAEDPLQFLQKFSAYAEFHNRPDAKSRHPFSLCLQGESS